MYIAFGSFGNVWSGALYAAMTSKISSQQIVLPILLYPLIIPALLSAVKATSLAFYGGPDASNALLVTITECL